MHARNDIYIYPKPRLGLTYMQSIWNVLIYDICTFVRGKERIPYIHFEICFCVFVSIIRVYVSCSNDDN